MTENINWDEATKSGGFISLEEDKEKILKLTNWKFVKRGNEERIAPGEIEFIAEVLEEDGHIVSEIIFNTASKRLKKKLRPIFENKPSTDTFDLSIMKVGEKFNTQYSVKEITE